ncbi:DUF4263 domain-containing protein [Hymenobacter sp. PAMC 26628]|uniref:DUF4263 domain-containing protein n=1 Tax=Hymenobacter sp. PAMC 26628 TaxID=1484118 RepID=UPI0009020399|nr:DUF4263 domain-containing protein [Hymenobacter sp. PAMC 26628]
MNIVFILKNNYYTEAVRNHLSTLSEKDSLLFFYSYDKAEEFLTNNVVRNNLPLDLVITEDNIDKEKATDFLQRITRDTSRTYSNLDFNFYNIPIILIIDQGDHTDAYSKYKFSDVLEDTTIENFGTYLKHFISSAKTWRKQVLDELDNLGVKFNSGNIDYSYYFSSDRKSKVDTNILTKNFKSFPRKLNYDWLILNEKQIELGIDRYIKELKRATRLDKKDKEEKEFHNIFNDNSFLIKRDNYNNHWYEAKLHYNKKNFYEPDYSLSPNFSHLTDLSILEVKLPNERFIKKTKFHPDPYSSLMSYIFQVNDYKDYIESEEYQKKLNQVFGFIPTKVEYNLLIGRSADKASNIYNLNKRMRQMGALHINLLTYDELLDYQVKYLDRIKLLKVL